MATLHIEHPITDLETWLRAFNGFADGRKGAGVTAQRVFQPDDDDKYIYIHLDFDEVAQAEAFKGFLETVVWASRDASPGLAGKPQARILHEVDTQPVR